MQNAYEGLDDATRRALLLSESEVRARLGPDAEVFATNQDMIAAMAAHLEADYLQALKGGRNRVLMIVPVGPVGQYELLAQRCLAGHLSLNRLTLLIMDEYLTDAGKWIAEGDPLSFRRHLKEKLVEVLPEDLRPEIAVPDPQALDAVPALIARMGGVDVCYAGVGITGHLAFNDPIPGAPSVEYFARLPTRIVALSSDTLLINSVTAARGNVARIPRMAVTVGMKEILGARRLRIFMNRDWQSAAIRRLAFGPVTANFPASLVQNHPDWSLHVVENVLREPEPELR
jgi:glucosamine-6-phosphate deaminase